MLVARDKRHVLFIDTEGTFCGERLMVMLRSRKTIDIDIKDITHAISVAKICDIHDFFNLMYQVADDLEDKFASLSLIILDSIIALLVPHLIRLEKDGEKAEQLEVLENVIRCLNMVIMKRPQMCLIVTNGNSRWLGKLWKNSCENAMQISCRKVDSTLVRKVKLLKSSRLVSSSETTTHLILKNDGFHDFSPSDTNIPPILPPLAIAQQ